MCSPRAKRLPPHISYPRPLKAPVVNSYHDSKGSDDPIDYVTPLVVSSMFSSDNSSYSPSVDSFSSSSDFSGGGGDFGGGGSDSSW